MPAANNIASMKLPLLLVLAGALSLLSLAQRARAQQIKLYLKDGSYQLVKSYEVHGDRVRYYSLDDSQWEEMPLSLVDFDATKRAQQEESVQQHKQLNEAKEIEKERFERQAANTGYEVAPGIHLPLTEGVYAFDGLRVIPMIQSEGQVVTDKERMALNLALPALKKRALVVLPGPQAAVRISATRPVFFVQSADRWGNNAVLIPVKAGKQSRVVEKIQSGVGVGQKGEVREGIPLEKQEVAPGIFKLHPTQPLSSGEYAIGELLEDKLNLGVWDFGIEGRTKASKSPEEATTRPAPMSEHAPGEAQPDQSPQPRVARPNPASDPTLQTSPPPLGPQPNPNPQPPQH